MSENIHPFPERHAVRDQAATWLIRMDGDTPLSDAERQELREWLSRSSVHSEEMRKLATLWEKMNLLTELTVPLARIEKPQHRISFLYRHKTVGIVATLILGITVIISLYIKGNLVENQQKFYATAIGQQQSINLNDGSVAMLNTNSQIAVTFSDRFRKVRLLQGEVYFKVAKDSERPFQVYAGKGMVQAVGTAFSVRLDKREIKITVAEGRVSVGALDNQVNTLGKKPNSSSDNQFGGEEHIQLLGLLEAHQTATVRHPEDDHADKLVLEEVSTMKLPELDRQLSWQRGLLIFSGETLEQVVAEISRYTDMRIEIVDPSVRSLKIGGQFRVGEVEAMLDVLEDSIGLRVNRVDYNHVKIYPRGEN